MEKRAMEPKSENWAQNFKQTSYLVRDISPCLSSDVPIEYVAQRDCKKKYSKRVILTGFLSKISKKPT